ncbi:MAG: hypothetical protein ABR503_00285 [Chitinophagaceae bacterium]
MDEYYSWELGTDVDEECDQCGMKTKKSDGCCRDEVKVIKIQQDLFKSKSTIYSFASPLLIFHQPLNLLLATHKITLSKESLFHIPPLLTKQHTYISNCVFRI